MASVTLVYSCPVYVEVEDGQVTRVIVADEAVEFDHLLLDGKGEASEAWDDALAVAESADWPAWEFGY